MGNSAAQDAGVIQNPRLRIPELDGLRGIAIAMVLVYHLFQTPLVAVPGSMLAYFQAALRLTWSGVDLFFVLSGFLIGGILLDARESRNYYSVFYTRRFFRIVPIYALILLTVPALVSSMLARYGDALRPWLTADAPPWYAYWTFTQNFWMTHLRMLGGNGLAMTWSLAVEEQFYLTMPLYIRALSRRWLLRGVVLGICAAPMLRNILGLLWPADWVGHFSMMLCRADALLLGVLAAILLRDERWKERLRNSNAAFGVAISILLAGLAWFTARAGSPASPAIKSVGFTWLALFYFTILLLALTRPESLLSKVLRFRWLGWLGTLAYGVYLIHQPVQYLFFALVWHKGPEITGWATLLVALAVVGATLGLAALSWRFVEQPLIRFGHRANFEFGEASATKQGQRTALEFVLPGSTSSLKGSRQAS